MDHEGTRTFVTRGPWDVMSIVGVIEDFAEGYAKEVITVYVCFSFYFVYFLFNFKFERNRTKRKVINLFKCKRRLDVFE